MTKHEDRIEKWKGSNQNVPKSDLEPVLDEYFPGWEEKKGKGTSHRYKLKNSILANYSGYPYGCLTIPISGGQSIKPVYMKKLVKAIAKIKENTQNE